MRFLGYILIDTCLGVRVRRRFLWMALCAIAVFSFMAQGQAAAEFKKTKIAVLDFALQGEEQETKDMGKIVAEWLITGLVQAGRFDVIERSLLEKILKEQELPMYGIVDSKGAAKTGQIVGAKVVITGSVMKLRQFIEVSARIINVEDGSIIAAEKVKSDSAIRLEDLVSQMVGKIIQDFPLEGYIVARGDGNSVTVDIGKRAGAKVGKRFMVYKEGKVIKHPKTGEVLDVERVEIGELELREVKEKTSTGVVLSEIPPYKITYGQMVRSTAEGFAGEESHYQSGGETAAVSMSDFKVGTEYYLRAALRAFKNKITWENAQNGALIPAGEKITLVEKRRNAVRFTNKGTEYIFVYHGGKTPNDYMLSKFFAKEDPSAVIASYSNDVKTFIANGKAATGMTKAQVLYAMGVPLEADKKKTFNMTIDGILKSNLWKYKLGFMDNLYIKFLDDKVSVIKD
ncbi:MAG: hypothetical protein HY884_00325 [Deltaproteobacteria bacterium]|nr:hypothetical protein [Deltaproteobacteria bacterium]